MIKIQELSVLHDQLIKLTFSDGTVKVIDFKPFIGNNPLTSPLADPDYFRQVRTYSNGRGLYWPNDYDFCPDYLYSYAPAVQMAYLP